jgi:hypothetical protein
MKTLSGKASQVYDVVIDIFKHQIKDGPVNSDKDEKELLSMLVDKKITAEEFSEIRKYQMDETILHKLNKELHKIFHTEKKVSRSTEQNKYVVRKLGIECGQVLQNNSMSKVIIQLGKKGVAFRNDYKTNEEFFSKLVELSKGEDKLKTMIEDAIMLEVRKVDKNRSKSKDVKTKEKK